MIKYYSITNGRDIRREVPKETLDRVCHKLRPFERDLLHGLSFKIETEGDEASLELIKLVVCDDRFTVSSKLKIISAILAGEFIVDFQGRYYVHVFPQQMEGYLNASQLVSDVFFIDTKSEWGGGKTKFTKEEIEELKKMPSLKGINFDECLEEVEEDED